MYISVIRGWLLKTDKETNELYLQWIPCISGTTIHNVPLLVYGIHNEAQEGEVVLLYAYLGKSNRGASTPRGTPGDPQVEPKF